MTSLRQKLILAFGGLFIILTTLGLLSSFLLTQYSSTLDRLFRENYNSVVYGQNLKDTIDSLDELVDLGPNDPKAQALIATFESNLRQEQDNITLPSERELTLQLESAWKDYKAGLKSELDREKLKSLRDIIRHRAQDIINLNLGNIVSVDGQVKERAIFARNAMFWLVSSGIGLAVLFIALIGRSILTPLKALTRSVREIEQGNLDLTVHVTSRDELGQLAEAFNAMAIKLREYRRSDRAKLVRAQKTTQLALNTFPDAVAIVGLDGRIELANEVAQERFKLVPELELAKVDIPAIREIFETVSSTAVAMHPQGYEKAIQTFFNGREQFFLSHGVPILSEDKILAGVTLVLKDVTDLRRLDEMKSNILAVASHELKTPLTSLRMSTHLLLEERLGPLNSQQLDLLITARDDAERLNSIIESLLDMGQLESGRILMELKPVSPEELINEAVGQFSTAYRDKGINLVLELHDDLPEVLADLSRIRHVFSNLLDNALKYTTSGGNVTVSASRDGDFVGFTIADTGIGISEEALPHIFERFYRSPNQATDVRGAGLGLAIAHEIVEAHGGSMSAQSLQQEGTSIRFTLKGVENE